MRGKRKRDEERSNSRFSFSSTVVLGRAVLFAGFVVALGLFREAPFLKKNVNDC
jgi:hypothetical protein